MTDIPDGLHVARLDSDRDNPREESFAAVWKKEHAYHDLLDQLLQLPCMKDDPKARGILDTTGPYKMPLGRPTERDRIIAATVVQWLGSNVGLCFVVEALKNVGYTVKWPK